MKSKYGIPLNEFGFTCRKDVLRLIILEAKEPGEPTDHLEKQQYTEWLKYYRPKVYRGPDPRGPSKLIRSVEVDPDGGPTILTLVCGHRVERANHFSYKVGDVEHCVQCKGRGISGGSRWVKR